MMLFVAFLLAADLACASFLCMLYTLVVQIHLKPYVISHGVIDTKKFFFPQSLYFCFNCVAI